MSNPHDLNTAAFIEDAMQRQGIQPDPDYCQPFQVAMRTAPGASVCTDPDCDLSGGAAHAGWCVPCACGKEHAVVECPERWCFACEAPMSERRAYHSDGSPVTVTWYCYDCENAALWRLGRSVGK